MVTHSIIIIGGGPAGLMAAQTLAEAGKAVTIFERKPSLGRKFLMAGRGGLNLTHSEPLEIFMTRYREASGFLQSSIDEFTPADLKQWCENLGESTFIGSSGRVFPTSFKASPLLRAWIRHLETLGVQFKMQRQWTGWDQSGDARFLLPDGSYETMKSSAVLLALGGASWPNLGSDGSWAGLMREKNIPVTDFRAANCGFVVNWSDILRQKFSGQPLKTIAVTFKDKTVPGEIMISEKGIEGGAIYALSAEIRNHIEKHGQTTIQLDLRPSLTLQQVEEKLSAPRKRQSFSSYMERHLNLNSLSINLLREANREAANLSDKDLARLIKSLPLKLEASFPLDRAISSAGGIDFSALTADFMLHDLPGIFVAGEMLNWEAPTGGYLLQASFATGRHAAKGILSYTASKS